MYPKGQNFFNNPCPIATMVHGKQQQQQTNLAVISRDAGWVWIYGQTNIRIWPDIKFFFWAFGLTATEL